MVRKKDRFWEYAELLDGRFKCNFCKRDFAGGVPRVKSHLSGIRGRDIDICTMVPKDVQDAAIEAINGSGPNKRLKTTSSSSDEDHVTAKNRMQKESSFLDDLLAKLVLVNGLDLGVIQDSPFLDFVDALTKYGPGYRIPNYSMLNTKLFPSLAAKIKDYVNNVKKSWDKSGCTLISQICHDANNKTFAIITAYSPEGAVFLGSLETPKEDSRSSYHEDLAHFVIQHLGPKNFVQYIAGNAKIEHPCKIMQIGEHSVFRTQCAGIELQFLFNDIYHEVEWVRSMIDGARKVVAYIQKHDAISSLMRQYNNNQELKKDVPNKVSSNFDMFTSIIKFKKELLSLVSSSQWIALVNINEETGKEVTEIIQGAEFWTDGEEILPLFESLLQVVRLVDSHGSNFGYLYGAMEMAEATFTHLNSCHPEKYKRIWEIFVERKGNIIHPLHAAAAFLNPAYMCSEKFSESKIIKEGIDFLVENFIILEEREAFTREMIHYRGKPTDLFKCVPLTMLKTSHPRVWWDYCGDSVPILKKYALKILSQPCSTSSIKGCISGSENVRTMVQWRSKPASMGKFLYLRTNALLMEKFHAMKEQMMKPINLENLDELLGYTFSNDYFLDLIDQSLELNPLSELEFSGFRSTEKSASQGKVLQLQFKTDISSRLPVGDKVTGEHGASIDIVLVDSQTGDVLQAGSEAKMKLTIVVLEGGFDKEATRNWTHEEFESGVILRSDSGRAVLTGDLEVILYQGVGTVGALTFNENSSWTASGKFRLGVKATTECCPNIRFREGISNAFIVEERDYGIDLFAALGSEIKDAIPEVIEHFPLAFVKAPRFTSIMVVAFSKMVRENLIHYIRHISGGTDTVTINGKERMLAPEKGKKEKGKERVRLSDEPKDKRLECCSARAQTPEPHTLSYKNQTYQVGSPNQVVGDGLTNIQATHNSSAAGMSSSTPASSCYFLGDESAPGSMHEQWEEWDTSQSKLKELSRVALDGWTNIQATHNSSAVGMSSSTPASPCYFLGEESAPGSMHEQWEEWDTSQSKSKELSRVALDGWTNIQATHNSSAAGMSSSTPASSCYFLGDESAPGSMHERWEEWDTSQSKLKEHSRVALDGWTNIQATNNGSAADMSSSTPASSCKFPGDKAPGSMHERWGRMGS